MHEVQQKHYLPKGKPLASTRSSDIKSRVPSKQQTPIPPQYGHRSVLGNNPITKIDNRITKINRNMARTFGKRFHDNRVMARQ